jgi:hypothetical protein
MVPSQPSLPLRQPSGVHPDHRSRRPAPGRRGREPSGIDTRPYRQNPVLVSNHDPSTPVGKCVGLHVAENELRGTGEFAPAGVSQRSDAVCALLKAGVLNSVFDWI